MGAVLAWVVLVPGTLLRDKYRLDREIGRGGMGSVWRATRIDLGTDLAVKVLHASASSKAAALGRFEREAKAAASLSSPHVVRIIDFGIDEAKALAFLAMELLVGESLGECLKRSGRLAPAQVAGVITQVARALNQAHGLGIVHRDLKPANVFLVQNEDEHLVKLLDFGIAKANGGVDEGLLTETGNVLGTPHYMSPEQLSSSKGVDHRADLWSLAVIACECMTGQRPFRADSLGELAMRISLGRCEPPSSVAPVPVGFDEWFARATQIDPAQRFQTASALAAALTALVAAAQGHGHLSRAGIVLDPTWPADGAAALRVPSQAPSEAPSAVAAVPTVATASTNNLSTGNEPTSNLSTTNMGSVLSTSGGVAERARPRWRTRRLWLAAGVVVAAVAGAASWREGLRSSASLRGDEPSRTLGSRLPDPLPAPLRAEHLPSSNAVSVQVPTSNASAQPAVAERAAAASVTSSTSVVTTAESPPADTSRAATARAANAQTGSPHAASAAAGQRVKTAVLPPPRRKRSLAASADRVRAAATRSTPKDNLNAYDWQ
jgi:serine/threonine-protein kinase